VRLTGGAGKDDPKFQVAGARSGARGAGGKVASQGGAFRQGELTVELGVDLLDPFLMDIH
jgi:hypothetical protein